MFTKSVVSEVHGEQTILVRRAGSYRPQQVTRINAETGQLERVRVEVPDGKIERVYKGNNLALTRLKTQLSHLVVGDSTATKFVSRMAFGCFTKDTKVSLLDGTERSFEELLNYRDEFWVYSYDVKRGRVVPGKAKRPFLTQKGANLVEVTIRDYLGNIKVVRCTLNHPWMMRDGFYKNAESLSPGDSLMPLYREDNKGYEVFLSPATMKWLTTHWMVVHELGARCTSNHVDGCEGCKLVVHHKNFDHRNNDPTNLTVLFRCFHRAFHRNNASSILTARNLKSWSENYDKMKEISVKNISDYNEWINNSDNPQARNARMIRSKRSSLTMTRLNKDPNFHMNRGKSKASRMAAKKTILFVNSDNDSRRKQMVGKIAVARKLLIENGFDPVTQWDEGSRYLKSIGKMVHSSPTSEALAFYNHTVVSVKRLDYVEDVYCLEVEKYHNFALTAGVFVHNTGGHVPGDPSEPVNPTVNDAALETVVLVKPITMFEFPSTTSVLITAYILEGEANGFAISEAGLVCGDNTLVARRTFGALSKSSDWVFQFNHVLMF
jgi:hypothetical protein